MKYSLACLVPALFGHVCACASAWHVGPAQAYANISGVPIENLAAGDTLYIHYRSAPYAEKFVLGAAGTQARPVVVHGVAGPGGELPVITGDGATTRLQLDFWSEVRGIIKVGGTSAPADSAAWIVIENLELHTARPGFYFSDDAGNSQQYSSNAAAIFIERGNNITLRNLVMRDCGNGLFIASASSDITVEYCRLYDNGIEGSIYEHNSYTEAGGITFQFNKYGRLRANCPGNNLKDRSRGTVIRYNWIYGGNRQLDLVDSGQPAFHADPGYNSTHVYGNILIEPEAEGNRQVVHYGGDSGDETRYRKGTLHFYNNTVISSRAGNNTLLRLSSMGESADVRNNVIYALGQLEISGDDNGTVDLRNNWIKAGWVDAITPGSGNVNDIDSNITGADPGFMDQANMNYNIAPGSPLISAATAMHASVPPALYPVMELADSVPGLRVRADFADIGAISYDEATGMEAEPAWTGLSLFPNPARPEFTVRSRTAIMEITLRDMSGRTMQRLVPNSPSAIVRSASLSGGIYIVECLLEDGQRISVRLLKE